MFVRTLIPALLTIGLVACGGPPPTVEGRVVDLWDAPVEGAKVQLVGNDTPSTTNGKGRFTFPMAKKGKVTFKTSREGYISATENAEVKDPEKFQTVNIEMIPEPSTDGYHLIGDSGYLTLGSVTVEARGNDLKSWFGIEKSGDIEVTGKPFRAVFHTPLKMDEVARLGVSLHRLTFIEKQTVLSAEGEQEIPLNLWVSDGEVAYEKQTLVSDDNYMFTVEELPSGTYAFVSMGLLTPANALAFGSVPAKVRTVHPFTVN